MRFIVSFILFFCFLMVHSQSNDSVRFQISGYVSDLGSLQHVQSFQNWDNIIHNRMNMSYQWNRFFSSNIEFRNRLLFADIPQIMNYKQNKDIGFINLNFNILSNKNVLLNTSIDRAYTTFEREKLKVTIGRQRINWGQTFAWNPNDIFNTYSFFDFDYVERSGSDAIRCQYFTTETSASEFAIKTDSTKKITAAAMYRWNSFGYDFQCLGGVLNSTDLVIGTGWSGSISSVAFRGEMSYFSSFTKQKDTGQVFLLSVGFDYVLPNMLSFQTEFLYNKAPKVNFNNLIAYYSAPISVKNIAFSTYNLFFQSSYPITPLVTGSFSTMYLPDFDGYVFSPNLSFSVSNNIDISTFVQYFSLHPKNGNTMEILFAFLRAKYSF